MKFLLSCGIAALLALPAAGQQNLSGTPEIKLALDKLNVLGSVLMIAAHPDDENTAVLAYWARGRKFETAYLSCTRGEGGQNLLGSEQGDLLGVIRTQELLAARRIDGAHQFFTRAIDFGFTKTPEETFEKWGHEQTLAEVVWVIRTYRPDAIVLRFSGTPRDGHGQHQASAILGKEAFTAAADPKRFPEQLTATTPWQAKRLLWNAFTFTPEQEKEAEAEKSRIEFDTGTYDPVLGKSYGEIAGISRSQHRSQAMGSAERKGPSRNFLTTIAGDAAKKDLFDGVDVTWNRLPGGAAIGQILGAAAANFVPEHPERTIPALLQARPLIAALAAKNDLWAERKLVELDEAVALCSGLFVEAEADRYSAVPGGKLKVTLSAINRSNFTEKDVTVRLSGPGADQTVKLEGALDYNKEINKAVDLTIPPGTKYSQPFWLAAPHSLNHYEFTDQQLVGRADTVPVMTATFEVSTGTQRISLTRPVHYRYVDRLRGELVRPLTIVPAVALNLSQPALVFTSAQPRKLEVVLHANMPKAQGVLHVETDPGWKVEPASLPFSLKAMGEESQQSFTITPAKFGPETGAPAHFRVFATVGEATIDAGVQVIAYEHIPPQTIFKPSSGLLREAPLTILSKRVGYIAGAGDEVPDSLRQMGCDVTLLSEADLTAGDLSRFDAIVTGVRAFNVRPDLKANRQRLLDYVNGGGTLIVQYNTPEGGGGPGGGGGGRGGGGRGGGGRGNAPPSSAPPAPPPAPVDDAYGPYPFHVGRERVTVEESPVEFVSMQAPLLRAPNAITAKDFEGWIQERGLYFATEWDSHYQPVISTHDPGEKPLPGGMLYARYGKGVYIFSAYSWFRQLPAGVPGAYRIFANMLSAGKVQ
jgi:LmbE family N-acetylglucosaminyl deacetylase